MDHSHLLIPSLPFATGTQVLCAHGGTGEALEYLGSRGWGPTARHRHVDERVMSDNSESDIDTVISSNIVQCLGTMLDTVVF